MKERIKVTESDQGVEIGGLHAEVFPKDVGLVRLSEIGGDCSGPPEPVQMDAPRGLVAGMCDAVESFERVLDELRALVTQAHEIMERMG